MSLELLSKDETEKLKQFMDAGLKILQEVDDLKGSLKDTASDLAKQLEVKPAVLMKALKVAYKSSLDDERSSVDTVESILSATGKI